MKKNAVYVMMWLCIAVLFVACNDDDKAGNLPQSATIAGTNANECPDATVLLTATAEDATSFAWYNGSTKITDAVEATYSVTTSGTYYAAGVNEAGEGAKSAAKAVAISDCLSPFIKMQGTYNATGAPQGIKAGATPAWISELYYDEGDAEKDVAPFLKISNWADLVTMGTDIDESFIFINIDENNKLILDQYTPLFSIEVPGKGMLSASLTAWIMDGANFEEWVETHEVMWDAENSVLDFSGTYKGKDIVLMVTAYNIITGDPVGAFTDGYKNVKLTKTSASGASFSGTKVALPDGRIPLPHKLFNKGIKNKRTFGTLNKIIK